MSLKNIWSLNIDELLVADKLRQELNKKNCEVFFPLNSQMKDIDLALMNLANNKISTIQVKGSRTYEPRKSEIEKFGEGSAAWFILTKSNLFKKTNKANYYIFVLHSYSDGKTRKEIKIDYLIIPAKDVRNICLNKKIRKGGKYHFFIWIDSKGKRAFDFNFRITPMTKYLNNWSLLK